MITKQEIEVIYYRCFNASILNDMKTQTLYFEILRNIFTQEDNKEIMKDFLDKDKANVLKRIKQEIKTGKHIEELEPIMSHEENIEPTEKDIRLERDLVKASCKNLNLLERHLGPDLTISGIEFPTFRTGGKCDLVLRDSAGVLYPVEFKLNQATHAVVGQIKKYTTHFNLQLIYKLYDKVQGVVVANSFSKYAINELLKRNIICLQYSLTDDVLKFTPIINHAK